MMTDFYEDMDLLEQVELMELLNEGSILKKIRELIYGKNRDRGKKILPKSSTASENISYIRKMVSSKSEMDKFYENSDLTLEGVTCTKGDCQYIANFLAERFEVNTPIKIYGIKGKDMNKIYDLSGNNTYQDDLTIIVIPLKTLKDIKYSTDAKYALKARYFNDVVDNNEYREYIAGRHEKSNQIQWLIDAHNKSN